MAKYKVKYRHRNAITKSGWNMGELRVDAASATEAKSKTVEHINKQNGGGKEVEILSVLSI